MLNNFESPNNSLSEDLFEEAKTIFEQQLRGNRLRSFDVGIGNMLEIKFNVARDEDTDSLVYESRNWSM